MIQALMPWLLWSTALGCALMAGVYFAFSSFVMRAFAALTVGGGIAAMQAVNRVILNSSFMTLFFGTTIASAVLLVLSLMGGVIGIALPVIVGAVLYLCCMFASTAIFNVPLNNRLADAPIDEDLAATLWDQYLDRWTRWNHLRTAASTGSAALYLYAAAQL